MLQKTFINNQLGIKFESYVDQKCRVWFKAKEVTKILGYRDTDKAIRKHVSENHKRTFLTYQCETHGQVIKDKKSLPAKTAGQVQGRWIIFLDEAGFYELVLNLDCLLQKCFANGYLLKFFLQFENMVTIEL